MTIQTVALAQIPRSDAEEKGVIQIVIDLKSLPARDARTATRLLQQGRIKAEIPKGWKLVREAPPSETT